MHDSGAFSSADNGFASDFGITVCDRFACYFKHRVLMSQRGIDRAYTISRRAAWVRWMLAGLLLLVVPVRTRFTDPYSRSPGHCLVGTVCVDSIQKTTYAGLNCSLVLVLTSACIPSTTEYRGE
jgi:hypothetical protein